MKKLLILAAIFGAFTLTSCKKIWTCSCTVAGITTEVKSSKKMSKSEAKDWCNTNNNYCKLK